jgi:hypothetical protein
LVLLAVMVMQNRSLPWNCLTAYHFSVLLSSGRNDGIVRGKRQDFVNLKRESEKLPPFSRSGRKNRCPNGIGQRF